METNIDDMTHEIFSYLFELFFENGALDVYTENIGMKKNRPAIKLSILCKEKDLEKFKKMIFEETSTFGIREIEIKRHSLARKFIDLPTKYGNIKIKIGYYNNKMVSFKPEYEDCLKIAKEQDVPLKKVQALAKNKFISIGDKYENYNGL